MALRHNKKLSTFLGGIMSRRNGDYYLNCLHLFRTNNKLVSQLKVCENKWFG